MLMKIGSGFASAFFAEVAVPRHASLSTSSAACAVDRATSVAGKAMARKQV
jgi:hypothetical protein